MTCKKCRDFGHDKWHKCKKRSICKLIANKNCSDGCTIISRIGSDSQDAEVYKISLDGQEAAMKVMPGTENQERGRESQRDAAQVLFCPENEDTDCERADE